MVLKSVALRRFVDRFSSLEKMRLSVSRFSGIVPAKELAGIRGVPLASTTR